ncbi:hypothetical protein ABFA07_022581 [Porites harrisoni]
MHRFRVQDVSTHFKKSLCSIALCLCCTGYVIVSSKEEPLGARYNEAKIKQGYPCWATGGWGKEGNKNSGVDRASYV